MLFNYKAPTPVRLQDLQYRRIRCCFRVPREPDPKEGYTKGLDISSVQMPTGKMLTAAGFFFPFAYTIQATTAGPGERVGILIAQSVDISFIQGLYMN